MMPCFGKKCLYSHLNSTNHTLSMAENGKMTIFHGKSLDSIMIPLRNVIYGPVRFRGYKSTNWGQRWWGVNHLGGWGVDHCGGEEDKMCKKSQKAKYKKQTKMVKDKEELKTEILHFLFVIIVTTLYPTI